MLEARNIVFSYDREQVILNDVSISIAPGEIVALHAPSGVGKTTLCYILAGLLHAQSGTLTIDGKPLAKRGVCPVQIIAQHPERMLDPLVTIEKSLREVADVPVWLMEAFGVKQEWLTRYPSELSGGEMQRICIVRALSVNPRYLICDEISTMLDAVTQVQIWDALKVYAANNGVGMLIVTHSAALRERLATRVVEL